MYDYHTYMKTIPLTKGLFTKIDDDDYKKFAIYRWYALFTKDRHRATRVIYKPSGEGKGNRVYLSREIMNAEKGMWVDHINNDSLDNRKKNLRICSPKENARNRKIPNNNTSGYKGVIKSGLKKRPWKAQIKVNGKSISIGTYINKKDAANAYNKAAKKYFGKFAKLNMEATKRVKEINLAGKKLT